MTDEMYKPDFDGERPPTRLIGPEKQTFLPVKPDLVRRIHAALLTLSVQPPAARLGVGSGSPHYVQEFSDRVGEETKGVQLLKWEPTAAQVSDMVSALRLLDGLRKPFYGVVYLRALDEFAREQGEIGPWPWAKIGAKFGMSDRWAEAVYDAAIVQAARRAGILEMFPQDYAVLAVSVWIDRGWLTCLTTSADPRQEAANLRAKSPVKIETAFAIWTSGKPVARRLVEETKAVIRGLHDHASWFKSNPESVAETLIAKAREINAPWHMEDMDMLRLKAA